MSDLAPGSPASDRHWLRYAIELSGHCPPADTAFSVGAVVVDADGRFISDGYSREADPHVHAEESALSKVDSADPRLGTATIYSSLEPCSKRASRPVTCAQLIAAAGIRRVVYALAEPAVFVDGRGAELLSGHSVTVVQIADLADEVRAVNAHLLAPPHH